MKKYDPPKTGRNGKAGTLPSKLIDAHIKELGGWRGETLARIRALIKEADPEVVEEWKWGIPVWSHDGISTRRGLQGRREDDLRQGRGASGPSPLQLESRRQTRRAIDIPEGGKIDEKAFKSLIRAAVTQNASKPAKKKSKKV